MSASGMHLSALINWAHETFADGRPTPASNGMLCIEDSQIEKVAPINIDARHSALQLQIDSLYSTLLDTTVAEAYRRESLENCVELCQRERLVPTRALINGITEGTIVGQTPTIDILHGRIGDRRVSLRLHRLNSRSQSPQDYDASAKAAIKDIIMSSGLVHSRIVPFEGLYRIGSGIDRMYLVQAPYDALMEYLFKRPGADCRMLLKHVAEGLAYLHEHAIAHCAVNDNAVLVDNAGKAYLSDFSQTHFVGSEFTLTTHAQSVAWLAPEHLEALQRDECLAPGKGGDVYAFGCLAFKVFVGKGPFEELMGSTCAMAFSKIVNAVCERDRRPAKPAVGDNAFVKRGLTEAIWEKAIEACWKRDPRSRPDAPGLVRSLS